MNKGRSRVEIDLHAKFDDDDVTNGVVGVVEDVLGSVK